MLTGKTNSEWSSSGVRVTPAGASTDVGPCQGSQPRDSVNMASGVGRTERAQLVRAAQDLFERVHHRHRQPLAAPVLPNGDRLEVAAAQRGAAVDHPALDDRAMRDERAVMADQRMHAAEGVLPVGVGEVHPVAVECLDDHLAGAFAGLDVEICGVDQACRVDLAHARSKGISADVRSMGTLGVHTVGSTRTVPSWGGQSVNGRRGRDQWNRTCWPGRICATLSMSESVTTPITG